MGSMCRAVEKTEKTWWQLGVGNQAVEDMPDSETAFAREQQQMM